MKARRRSTGLRQLLIAEDDAFRDRWQRPQDSGPLPTTDAALDLRAGRAVLVSSAQVLRALMRAGLPHADFAYGGRYWNKPLLLGTDDSLTEYDPLDAKQLPDGNCHVV